MKIKQPTQKQKDRNQHRANAMLAQLLRGIEKSELVKAGRVEVSVNIDWNGHPTLEYLADVKFDSHPFIGGYAYVVKESLTGRAFIRYVIWWSNKRLIYAPLELYKFIQNRAALSYLSKHK